MKTGAALDSASFGGDPRLTLSTSLHSLYSAVTLKDDQTDHWELGMHPSWPQNSVALNNTKEQASWMGNSGTPTRPAYHRIPSTSWETPDS